MSVPALIGIDWGTTSLRAYLMDARGTVLDVRSAPMGVMQVEPGGFDAVFEAEIGPWLDTAPDLPVLASGMVGGRQGWVEVPYAACPVAPGTLADALHPILTARGRRLRIVPGLVAEGAFPDVMRGEETEILGALQEHPQASVFVLPGTHSKWVRIEARRIAGFDTFMTGELFAVLRHHSILGRLIEGDGPDEAAFGRGAALGLSPDPAAGGLLHRLFSARTLALRGQLEAPGVAAYLSGLLIGSEVREATAAMAPGADGRPVVLVGGSELIERYVKVLARAGIPAARAASDAAARGLFHLAQVAGLLE